MNLFKYIFDFKLIKNKKRGKKGLIIAWDLCGCDVARKATWQSHADPRERLRGTEVTCAIFIFTRNI